MSGLGPGREGVSTRGLMSTGLEAEVRVWRTATCHLGGCHGARPLLVEAAEEVETPRRPGSPLRKRLGGLRKHL